MARSIKTWKAQEEEIARRRVQIEDFIVRNNALKRERDDARKESKRLVEILRDVAFAEESKAREVARKALARIERKAEKVGIANDTSITV